jgi:hypothetical protein
MATIVKYFGATNSFSVSGASGLVQVVGSGVDNGFTVPQTFDAPVIQTPGQGANNETPFAQYGDLFSDAMLAFTAPATSSTLSSTLPAATVYVLGQRVVIPDTAFTVTASATSYLDLSNTGALTVSTSSTVTANSLRLWSVVSSATAITGVTQIAASQAGVQPATESAAPVQRQQVAGTAVAGAQFYNTAVVSGTLYTNTQTLTASTKGILLCLVTIAAGGTNGSFSATINGVQSTASAQTIGSGNYFGVNFSAAVPEGTVTVVLSYTPANADAFYILPAYIFLPAP